MSLPIEVAGNFMELRTNHFHSGLDMKTNGRIGQPVMAVADGWVSRIKTSPWGYGKAIYIDHPSGYTTVYGHLDRLHGPLANRLLEIQYANRDFSIDQYFKQGELPVSQGQIIAFSGNTGGSTAPHLHFEVRRTTDQHALDPEDYGMKPPDKVFPLFAGLRLYPLDSASRCSVYPSGNTGFTCVQLNDSTYKLSPPANVAAWGTVGLAVNVTDRYSNSSNTCGVRAIRVSVDGTDLVDIHLDEIDFGLQRYANAYMDYGLFKERNMHYNRCFKLPNNRLDVYGRLPTPGQIRVVPGKDHAVQVVATDAAGNRSQLNFTLHGAGAEEAAQWNAPTPKGQLFRYDKPQIITLNGMRFSLPPNALYEDTYLATSMRVAPETALTPLYQLQNDYTPLQLAGELAIDIPSRVAPELFPSLLVVRMVKGKPVPQGGAVANGKITASVKELGAFTVMLDTTPPVLTPIGISAEMKGKKGFAIRVRDNLSGVGQWTGTLDGKWILLEYEPKSGLLQHQFDKYSDLPGPHEFILQVTDERGNRSSLTRKFSR